MPIKIDKDIPIPVRKVGRGIVPDNEYPWDRMECGDSFFLPGNAIRQKSRAEASFYNWRNRWSLTPEDFKIVTRQVEGGLRVWRVE